MGLLLERVERCVSTPGAPFAGELFACLAEALSETVERPRCVDEAYRRAIVDVARAGAAARRPRAALALLDGAFLRCRDEATRRALSAEAEALHAEAAADCAFEASEVEAWPDAAREVAATARGEQGWLQRARKGACGRPGVEVAEGSGRNMRTSSWLITLVVAPGAALLAPPVRRLRAAPPSMAMVPAPGSEVVFENINLLGFIGRGLRSVRRVAALDPMVVLRELQRAAQFDDLVAILLFNALVDPALRTLWRLRRGDDGAPFEASIYAAVRPALRLLGGVLGGLYVLDVAFVCASIAELQPPWRVPQLVAGMGYTLVAGKLLTSLKDRFLEHRVLPSIDEKKKNRANVFVIKRGTGVAIWALCAAVCFEVLRFSIGLTLGSIFSFAGISGIALGFATKDLVSNWVGGALLVLTQPFVPGAELCGNRPLVWGVPTRLQNSLSPLNLNTLISTQATRSK